MSIVSTRDCAGLFHTEFTKLGKYQARVLTSDIAEDEIAVRPARDPGQVHDVEDGGP